MPDAFFNPRTLYRKLPVREPDTVLNNLFGFVDRPGQAIRSLLAGKPGAAARHTGQFAVDAFLGGFLKRGPIQLDRPEDKTEASQILEAWHLPAPREGTWTRFGVDAGGAFALDPLNFVSFVGPALKVGRALGVGGKLARAEAAADIIYNLTKGSGRSLLAERYADELAKLKPRGRPPGPPLPPADVVPPTPPPRLRTGGTPEILAQLRQTNPNATAADARLLKRRMEALRQRVAERIAADPNAPDMFAGHAPVQGPPPPASRPWSPRWDPRRVGEAPLGGDARGTVLTRWGDRFQPIDPLFREAAGDATPYGLRAGPHGIQGEPVLEGPGHNPYFFAPGQAIPPSSYRNPVTALPMRTRQYHINEPAVAPGATLQDPVIFLAPDDGGGPAILNATRHEQVRAALRTFGDLNEPLTIVQPVHVAEGTPIDPIALWEHARPFARAGFVHEHSTFPRPADPGLLPVPRGASAFGEHFMRRLLAEEERVTRMVAARSHMPLLHYPTPLGRLGFFHEGPRIRHWTPPRNVIRRIRAIRQDPGVYGLGEFSSTSNPWERDWLLPAVRAEALAAARTPPRKAELLGQLHPALQRFRIEDTVRKEVRRLVDIDLHLAQQERAAKEAEDFASRLRAYGRERGYPMSPEELDQKLAAFGSTPPPPPPPGLPPGPLSPPPPPPDPLQPLLDRLPRLASLRRYGDALSGTSPAVLAKLEQQIETRAIENILQTEGGMGPGFRLAVANEAQVDEAILRLQAKGIVEVPRLRLGVPFTSIGVDVPGTRNWTPWMVADKWLRYSAPGLAVRGTGKVLDRFAPKISGVGRELGHKVVNALRGVYDRTLVGGGNATLRLAAKQSQHYQREEQELGRRYLLGWALDGEGKPRFGWDETKWRTWGQVIHKYRDLERQLPVPPLLGTRQLPPGRRYAAILRRQEAMHEVELLRGQLLHRFEEELKQLFPEDQGAAALQLYREHANMTRQIQEDLMRERIWPGNAFARLSRDNLDEQGRFALDEWERLYQESKLRELSVEEQKLLRDAENELRDLVPRMTQREVLFYLPRQIKAEFRPLLRGGRKAAPFARSGVKDVFTRPQGYESMDEWADMLAGNARAAGLPGVETREEALAKLVEWDPRKLMANRLDLHARTLGRNYLRRAANLDFETAQLVDGVRKVRIRAPSSADDRWADYVAHVWEPVRPRGFWQAILGGGTVGTVQWPGINTIYKTALYAPWPSSWVRNFASAMVQFGLTGEGGGLRAMARTLMTAPLLRWLGKGRGDHQIELLLKVATGNAADTEVKLAYATLRREKIGRYSGDEVLKGLGAVIGHGGGILDIDSNAERMVELAIQAAAAQDRRNPMTFFRKWAQLGYHVTNHVENAYRVQHYVHLLQKGWAPKRAATATNRAMIDYTIQGGLDRWYRDLILFGRYGVGIVPPVAEAALRRPASVGIFAALQQASLAEDREPGLLPEYIRGGLGIRLPGKENRWLTSLGLPIEAAAEQVEGFDVIPGRDWLQGPRRKFLAGLTPPIRMPLEALTNRNFYFGDEWASYRRAPGAWKALTGQEEVPGWSNELIRSLPTSRALGTINRIVGTSEVEGPLEKLLTLGTGLRVRQIDTRRSAQRVIEKALEEAEGRGEVGRITRAYEREGHPLTPEAKNLLEIQKELDRARKRHRRLPGQQ